MKTTGVVHRCEPRAASVRSGDRRAPRRDRCGSRDAAQHGRAATALVHCAAWVGWVFWLAPRIVA